MQAKEGYYALLDECKELAEDLSRAKFSRARDLLELDARWQVGDSCAVRVHVAGLVPLRGREGDLPEPDVRWRASGVLSTCAVCTPGCAFTAAPRDGTWARDAPCRRPLPGCSRSPAACARPIVPRQAVDSNKEREELFEDWLEGKEREVRGVRGVWGEPGSLGGWGGSALASGWRARSGR